MTVSQVMLASYSQHRQHSTDVTPECMRLIVITLNQVLQQLFRAVAKESVHHTRVFCAILRSDP